MIYTDVFVILLFCSLGALLVDIVLLICMTCTCVRYDNDGLCIYNIYVYIQYVHGLWIFNTFNHRSNYWTKTNTLVKCNRTILSTVQVLYIILNNASILYIAYRVSYVWTFTMQYVFVMLFNYVSITVPTESKVAIWAVDAQAISLQQFVILAASCPGKSPGGGRFVRKAGSDSVSVWNIILYWDRSQHDEIRRGDINTP